MLEAFIIGGGLAGWSLFTHLHDAGIPVDKLGIMDKGVSARGASGVLRGMLHPFTGRTLFPKPGAMEAWVYAREWLHKMQNEAQANGFKTSFYKEHSLWRIAVNTEGQEQFARSFERATESLDNYPVKQIPNTDPLKNVLSGYVFTEAGSAEIQRLLAYFQHRYRAACFLHQTDNAAKHPYELAWKKDHWQIVTAQQTFKTKQLILAPGHELLSFFPEVPLRTKRGEVIYFESPAHVPHCVSGGGRYVVPIGKHNEKYTYVTGATFYRDNALWPPETSWRDLCSRFQWFPELEKATPLRVWSGVRATLHPDRQPLCGPVPGYQNLWLMGAFSTRGLLQIPRHARALSHALVQAKTTQLPTESLPERVLSFKSSLRSQSESQPQGVFTLLNRV